MQLRQDNLNTSDCIKIGVVTGIADAAINLPLWTIKTRAQCNLSFTLNPRILYRGFCIDLGMISVITGTQVFLSNVAEQLLDNKLNHSLDEKQNHYRIAAAFMGGISSGGIFSPLDLFSMQQHKHHRNHYFQSAWLTYQQIGLRKMGIGLPATCLTDGVFTALYYGVYPLFKNKLSAFFPYEMGNAILSGITMGGFASLITHPLDMIKIKQQLAVDEEVKSISVCIKELYQRQGGLGFFTGFKLRTLWATSYIAVSSIVADKVETWIKKNKK